MNVGKTYSSYPYFLTLDNGDHSALEHRCLKRLPHADWTGQDGFQRLPTEYRNIVLIGKEIAYTDLPLKHGYLHVKYLALQTQAGSTFSPPHSGNSCNLHSSWLLTLNFLFDSFDKHQLEQLKEEEFSHLYLCFGVC